MALLAALGAVPQGVAQQEMTLTSGNQEHISILESTDIYISGEVTFRDNVRDINSPSGAAISLGPSSGRPSEAITLTIKGSDDQRSGELNFINNVQDFNGNKQHYGGAIGSLDLGYDIELKFANLLTLNFDNNRQHCTVPFVANIPSVGGGSLGVAMIDFSNIGTVSFTGSFDWTEYEGGEIDESQKNASKGGAIRCRSLIVDHVDVFSIKNTLTYGNSSGSGAISSGWNSGNMPTKFSHCGLVDISYNTLVGNPNSDGSTGSAIYVNRQNLIFAGNDNVQISSNYSNNYATIFIYDGNERNRGNFDCYLNREVRIENNRSGGSHAGVQMYLVDAENSDGRALLSADLGDIIFRNNIGGQNRPGSDYATALKFFGGIRSTRDCVGEFRAMSSVDAQGNKTPNYVRFYDPIRVELYTADDGSPYMYYWPNADTKVAKLQFNMPSDPDALRDESVIQAYEEYFGIGEIPAFDGTIQFSGEYYREVGRTADSYLQQRDDEDGEAFSIRLLLSRWSTVQAESTLGDGELLIENGAVYGDELFNYNLEYKQVTVDGGGSQQSGQELSIAMDPYDGDGDIDDAWRFELDTSLDIQKGALAIRTDGIVIAKNISFSGHDAMLRMDDTARIIADRVDLTKGVSVDFNHALEHGVKIATLSDAGTKSHQLVHAKLTVTANSLDMGTTFTLGVPDHTTATPGEFYSGEAWKGDLTFAVLDVSHVLDKGGVASGDNLSIVSVASVSADTGEGTNLVAYEGGSQGEWSIHWGEGDDDQYVLYAEWKNTDPDEPDEPDEPGTDEPGTGDTDDPGTDEPDDPGTDEPDDPGTDEPDEPGTGDTDEPGDGGSTPAVDPGRVGVAVENSLWSTKGNAEQLQRAALAQVTAFRFMDHRATRLWGSVLGEYDRVNGSAGADGYEYSGEGYAVGMDRVWKNRYLLGAGFGQMFGKNRGRSLPDVIKQDSVMATVYGAAVQKLSDRDSLTYEGSLTLGWTDNEMSSWQSAVSPVHGDWDSKALLLKGDVIWSRRLSERSVLGLTAGLEFGRAWREGFTETGIGERRFDRSSLTVLSMPIGCSWTHESGIGGKPWVNTLYVAYVPDLYREDPKSAARDGQQAWEVRGVAPGRHALRVGYGTQWAVSESCTLYAGYSFEYRETAAYHNVNAGVSVAF